VKIIAELVAAAHLGAAMGGAQSTMLRPSTKKLRGHACQGGLFQAQHVAMSIFGKLQTHELMMMIIP